MIQQTKRKGGARLARGAKKGGGRASRPDPDETLIWRRGDPIKVSPAHFWDNAPGKDGKKPRKKYPCPK